MMRAVLDQRISDREDPLGVIRLTLAVSKYADQAHQIVFNREGFDSLTHSRARAKLRRLFQNVEACSVSLLSLGQIADSTDFVSELRSRSTRVDSLNEALTELFVEFYGDLVGHAKAVEFIQYQRPDVDASLEVIRKVDEELLAMMVMERKAQWFSGYFLVSNTVAGAGTHLTDVLEELQDARTAYRDEKSTSNLQRCIEAFTPETVFTKIEASGERLSESVYQAKELDDWRASLAELSSFQG